MRQVSLLPGLSGGHGKPGWNRAPRGLQGAGGGPCLLQPCPRPRPSRPGPARRPEPGGTAVRALMLLKINTAPHPRGENPEFRFSVDDLDDDAVASLPPSSFLLPVSDSFRMFFPLLSPFGTWLSSPRPLLTCSFLRASSVVWYWPHPGSQQTASSWERSPLVTRTQTSPRDEVTNPSDASSP